MAKGKGGGEAWSEVGGWRYHITMRRYRACIGGDLMAWPAAFTCLIIMYLARQKRQERRDREAGTCAGSKERDGKDTERPAYLSGIISDSVCMHTQKGIAGRLLLVYQI